jgi:hypothetical protein
LKCPGIEPPLRYGLPAVVVDNRVPQNAVKPRYGGFFLPQFPLLLENPQIRELQNIFRGFMGLDATLKKRQKSTALIEKPFNHARRFVKWAHKTNSLFQL